MSSLKQQYFIFKYLLILISIQSILFVSCDEKISTPQNSLEVITSKNTYHNEKVIIIISNYFDKNVYIQKCADHLLYYIERLDSNYSGFTAVFVCRQPYNVPLGASYAVTDTLDLFPGKYRTKHLYAFEDTQFLNNEAYSNTFIVY